MHSLGKLLGLGHERNKADKPKISERDNAESDQEAAEDIEYLSEQGLSIAIMHFGWSDSTVIA